MTQTWDGSVQENQTLVSLVQNPWKTTRRDLGIGFAITAVLVITLVVLITKKHLRNKQQLSIVTLHGTHMTALQSAATAQVEAELSTNVYKVEDNPYVMD